VRIEKIDRGPYSLGVEIVREKGGNSEAAAETVENPHPRVVYLANDVVGSDDLSERIDAMTVGDVPLIFCVGAGDASAPQSQICVWAPSKIVLDAVDGPSAGPRDSLDLVAWFAEYMQAEELVVIGDQAPECSIPVRVL